MLRLGTLNTKQDALDSSIRHRDSILRELFRATVAFRSTKTQDTVTLSEDAFLDANNISEGRYFNHATLPSLPSLPSVLDDVLTQTHGSGSGIDGAESTQDGSRQLPGPNAALRAKKEGQAKYDDTVGIPIPSNEGAGTVGTIGLGEGWHDGLITDGDVTKPMYDLGKSEHIAKNATASKAQSSQDDIGASPARHSQEMEESSAERKATGETISDAAVVHPSTDKVQEPAFDTVSRTEQDLPGDPHEMHTKESPLTDAQQTVLNTDVSENDGVRPLSQALNNDTIQNQENTIRTDDTYAETRDTPDEQLRLEQAQALHLSRLSTNAPKDEDLFTDRTIAGDEVVMDAVADQKNDDSTLDRSTSSMVESNEGRYKMGNEPGFSSQNLDIETSGLRENAFPAMNKDLPRDLTFSRRPPMRIDTDVPSTDETVRPVSNKKAITPNLTPFTPIEPATASRSSHATSQVSSPPERMTTRVSSGALRHKSVSEILGETPRHAISQSDKSSSEKVIHELARDESTLQTPRSAASIASPYSAAFKQRLHELKEKERSKLSTVVFARQQSSHAQRYGENVTAELDETSEQNPEPKDYLFPLFAFQAFNPPYAQSLHSLVTSAHKTLNTADQHVDLQEQQNYRVLTRIHQLQSNNRWSLRQQERSVEPVRPKAQWDALLDHLKWMRTDFREERKWKLAAAKSLADACAQWVKVRAVRPQQNSEATAVQTPDLIPSAEDDSDATDFEVSDIESAKRGAPASIFSLPPDMFVFGLERTPIAEKILSELPLYQPSTQLQASLLKSPQDPIDDHWKVPVVPFSRFVEGKLSSQDIRPPRKKSRYEYSGERDNLQTGVTQSSQGIDLGLDELGPAMDDVALFRPENKHIRDRIHAGHAFRPPSEYQMPSQGFFESRQSSQWTQAEDDDLRRLVREYAYNWSLISSCLSSPSLFSSGAERRTPWECFERWIDLEGLPAEMSKTQYFKAYTSRLQAAQRNHEAHQQALQQQGSIGQGSIRRRTTRPLLVERRKNNKHLHLVDAMRKLAKKRETAIHKQQHVAGLAAMRKQNEAVQTKATMHTPQEFSRAKYEREQKVQENARLYQQQMLQQREKAKNLRQGGPGNAQNMVPGVSHVPPSTNGSSPNVAPAVPNSHATSNQMGQMRPVPPMTRLPHGSQVPSSLAAGAQSIPHAPMQPQISMQQRAPAQMLPDNARIFQEATRLQEQQRRYLAAQTQHQHPQSNGHVGGTSSPPHLSHLNALNHQSNASLYGGLQGRSGSPSVNGSNGGTGSHSSPHMANPSQPQPLSSGMVPVVSQVQNQIKARHPQASPEQVKAMTTESLHQYRMSQAAMQAAAGSSNATGMPNSNGLNGLPSQSQQQAMMNGINGSPMMNSNTAQYAAMIRSQQAQQSRNASAGSMGAPRPASRSATPGQAPSQSPRPSQVQMAGGQ